MHCISEKKWKIKSIHDLNIARFDSYNDNYNDVIITHYNQAFTIWVPYDYKSYCCSNDSSKNRISSYKSLSIKADY